jgi:hypothetical protein
MLLPSTVGIIALIITAILAACVWGGYHTVARVYGYRRPWYEPFVIQDETPPVATTTLADRSGEPVPTFAEGGPRTYAEQTV